MTGQSFLRRFELRLTSGGVPWLHAGCLPKTAVFEWGPARDQSPTIRSLPVCAPVLNFYSGMK